MCIPTAKPPTPLLYSQPSPLKHLYSQFPGLLEVKIELSLGHILTNAYLFRHTTAPRFLRWTLVLCSCKPPVYLLYRTLAFRTLWLVLFAKINILIYMSLPHPLVHPSSQRILINQMKLCCRNQPCCTQLPSRRWRCELIRAVSVLGVWGLVGVEELIREMIGCLCDKSSDLIFSRQSIIPFHFLSHETNRSILWLFFIFTLS